MAGKGEEERGEKKKLRGNLVNSSFKSKEK
jgi:hypothetical protein